MLKATRQPSIDTFRNQPVIAYFENSKIKLQISEIQPPETFLEMYRKRQPTTPVNIAENLTRQGFSLANLGISIALEVLLPQEGRFAVFTRRGAEHKCLALISGYWDVSLDPTPEHCAKRELLEEMLVFEKSCNRFLVPMGMNFPYVGCQSIQSSRWTLQPSSEAMKWVTSAKVKASDIDDCYVYIDATTSSAQAVYGYSANFSDWEGLSFLHAEDQPDKEGNLIVTLHKEAIVLLKIQDNCLLHPAYCLENGHLVEIDLPDDAYFHPSMVGVDQFGIVASDHVLFRDIVI